MLSGLVKESRSRRAVLAAENGGCPPARHAARRVPASPGSPKTEPEPLIADPLSLPSRSQSVARRRRSPA